MPASFFMCAPAAARCYVRSLAIVACSAPTVRCRARRSRRSVPVRRAARAIARVEQMQNTSMPMPDIPSPDAYWEGLRPHLRPFSPDERHAAVALYRELAKGQAVADAQLAHALGISIVQSRALLQRNAIKPFIYRDHEGRVLGFGGLATTPMHHRFEVDGHELSTWCAWDSLFIPEILGRSARVASLDPDSGETVRLFVTPERIESI